MKNTSFTFASEANLRKLNRKLTAINAFDIFEASDTSRNVKKSYLGKLLLRLGIYEKKLNLRSRLDFVMILIKLFKQFFMQLKNVNRACYILFIRKAIKRVFK